MTRVAWILLLCVAIDFSDPLLPGAVRLDPSESIAGVPTETAGAGSVSVPIREYPLEHRTPPRCLEVRPARAIKHGPVAREWTLSVHPVRHSADDLTPASPAEDH